MRVSCLVQVLKVTPSACTYLVIVRFKSRDRGANEATLTEVFICQKHIARKNLSSTFDATNPLSPSTGAALEGTEGNRKGLRLWDTGGKGGGWGGGKVMTS